MTSPDQVSLTVCQSTSSTGTDSNCAYDCSTKVNSVYCANYGANAYYISGINACLLYDCYSKKIE